MNLFILLPFIPMLGGILTLIYHLRGQSTNLITNIFITISLILSLILVINNINVNQSFDFIQFNHATLDINLSIDRLSQVMLLMIFFISFVIHRYSTNYLSSDITQGRFMAQLSILTAAVSLLAISGNLLTAFIAWQFIGLSLYILLNHYHYDIFANKAAKKKFIINRVGDVSFLLAVILCYRFFGNSNFDCLSNSAPMINVFGITCSINTIIVLLIFTAIMTKSAQFPFHIWLPDTMEAPTPVSAIMHAGVINAGGFLLTRIHSMISMSDFASNFIYTIGVLTILAAAFFIITQSDVKKQLAYSTMGQMGYMVVECSLGFYSAAIFHLIAHGFFKAFLFLNSGSNIGKLNQNLFRLKTNFLSKLLKISIFLIVYFGIFYYINGNLNNSLLFTGAFILASLLNLYFDLESVIGLNLANKILLGIGILFIFGLYFIFSSQLTKFIQFDEMITTNHLFNAYKMLVLVPIIIAQLIIWLDINYINQPTKLIIYNLSRNKLFIEEIYRYTLVNPFRKTGSYFNQLFLNSYIRALSMFLIILITFLSIFRIEILSTITFLIIIEFLFLVYITTANRAPNLKSFINYILFSQICLIDMAIITISNHDKWFLYSQIINSLLIYLAIQTLIKTDNHISIDLQRTNNKLGITKTYFTLLMFFWIGLPSTPSFINELYVLYYLSQVHLYLIIIPILSFICLAIAILHVLQDYIFKLSNNQFFKTELSWSQHAFLWVCFLINITFGIMPNTLLTLLN